MSIRIYAQDSKYWMEDTNTQQTVELTKTIHQKRDNTTWFKLPDNDLNRKLVCKEAIDKRGEIIYDDYKETKTLGPKNETTPKIPKIDWTKYLTEDELEIFNDLKKKCEDRAATDAQRLKVEAIKRELAEATKKLEEMEG